MDHSGPSSLPSSWQATTTDRHRFISLIAANQADADFLPREVRFPNATAQAKRAALAVQA
jgi:hypothetical protein